MKLKQWLVLLITIGGLVACAPPAAPAPLPTPASKPLADFVAEAGPLLAARRYTEAAAVFEQAAQAQPADPAPLQQIGQIYLAQRRWRLAEDAFNRALARSMNNAPAMTGLAEALLNQRRLDEAKIWWQQAATLDPALPGVFTGLGRTYVWQFDLAAAQTAFKQQQTHTFDPEAAWYLAALTAPDDLTAAQNNLRAIPANAAPSLLARRDYLANALAAYNAKSPRGEVAKAVGVTLARLEVWPAAIDMLTMALAPTDPAMSKPSQAEALAFLAYASAQAGRPAVNLFEQAHQTDPTSSLPLYFEGLYLRQKGALKAAEDTFEQAVKLDPRNAALYAEIAQTKEAQGNLSAAEVWYTAAIEVAQDDAPFQLLLLKFYANASGELREKGIALAKTMLAANPNQADAYAGLGWIQFLSGDAANDEKSLQRAVELNPDLVSAQYHLARLWESRGQIDQARAAYQRVVDLDMTNTWRDQALKDLVRLKSK